MVKRISALAAVLLCVFMLCSCTASRSQISAYVRGTLDSVYLNENSDEYLKRSAALPKNAKPSISSISGTRLNISKCAWISTRYPTLLISAW